MPKNSIPADMKHNDALSHEIGKVLNGMIEGFSEEYGEAATRLLASEDFNTAIGYAKNGDAEKFWLFSVFKHQMVVEKAIKMAVSKDHRISFLMMNYDFVNRHLKRLFDRYEGMSCCADKSRCVINRYANLVLHDKPIVFNPSDEYTFHHPETILKDEDSIVRFMDGLIHLHSGNPDVYLSCLVDIQAAVSKQMETKLTST